MNFPVLLNTAFKALLRNLSRSLLTMLGIIIGVGAVIASVAIGNGAQSIVLKQIESLGANLIIISPGAINNGGVSLGAAAKTTLTKSDTDAIIEDVPNVLGAAPYSTRSTQVIAGNANWYTLIGGTTPPWLSVGNWNMAEGAFFTEDDVTKVAKVAVLGATVAANLFPSGGAVGRTVLITSVPFKVVGILAAKGQSGFGRDQDDIVIIPISSHQERLTGLKYVGTILVSAKSADTVDGVIDAVDRLLRLEHHLDPIDPDDFTIRNIASVQAVRTATSNTQSLLLAAVAIVSLVVGGIGIMNIMLVSVTERTREIGLRLAVGAKGRDILLQFLIESLTMASAGGVVGIGFGIGISFVVSRFAGWPMIISGFSVFLGFASAAFTGVVFGYYPARRAAALTPIDALRYE
jgi:putative ABC transport system permease protein